MNITIEVSDFKDAVEAVWLKGKYKSSTTSKTDVVSNSCLCICRNNRIEFYNGNDKSALNVNKIIDYSKDDLMFIFDIGKVMKYLKVFKETMTFKITDSNILLKSGNSSARIAKLVEHNNFGLISRIMNISLEPPVIFGKTELDCRLLFQGNDFANAIKFCNNVGTATFKLNYIAGQDTATISSQTMHKTEFAKKEFPIINRSEKSMTVEFSAPLDKFCIDEPMQIFGGDDKPLLLCGSDRKMIIAPYINDR
jgi:hypothetical protein